MLSTEKARPAVITAASALAKATRSCASFRDIVSRTRETCIDAYAHELPVNVIEQAIPDFVKSRENLRTSQFCLADFQSQYGDITFPIAARIIHERLLQEPEHPDVPSGLVWDLDILPSCAFSGTVLYNLDEFDEGTVSSWTTSYRRILTSTVRDPDKDWQTL